MQLFVPKGAIHLKSQGLVSPTYAMLVAECKARDAGPKFLAEKLEGPYAERLSRAQRVFDRVKANDTHARDHVVERPWVELFTEWCRIHQEPGKCIHGRRVDRKYHDPACRRESLTHDRIRETQDATRAVLETIWGLGSHFDWWEQPEAIMADWIWGHGQYVLDELSGLFKDRDFSGLESAKSAQGDPVPA
jgi:hypothetical protein